MPSDKTIQVCMKDEMYKQVKKYEKKNFLESESGAIKHMIRRILRREKK